MKKLLALVVLAACETVPTKPSADKAVVAPSASDLRKIVSQSACRKHNWKDRGVAPIGYMEGVALTFARSVCQVSAEHVVPVAAKRALPEAVADSYDALSWFNSNFAAIGMKNDVSGVDTLRHTYALLLGLGMRESSGRYCTGRDMSAGYSSADSAEAGLFQASYATIAKHGSLWKLFKKYKADKNACLLDVFQQNISAAYCAKNAKNWGYGDGVEWQLITKACPAFAVEWAAVLLRVHGGTKGEFGPLRRKEAELRPECDKMLGEVQSYVQLNPSVCGVL